MIYILPGINSLLHESVEYIMNAKFSGSWRAASASGASWLQHCAKPRLKFSACVFHVPTPNRNARTFWQPMKVPIMPRAISLPYQRLAQDRRSFQA